MGTNILDTEWQQQLCFMGSFQSYAGLRVPKGCYHLSRYAEDMFTQNLFEKSTDSWIIYPIHVNKMAELKPSSE